MSLTKQPVNISFSKGLDTKNDPYQIPVGNFLALNNSNFNTIGRLDKRNGFGNLLANPANTPNYLATFQDSLIAIGTNVSAYTPQSSTWLNKGVYQNLNLDVTTLIRNIGNQVQCDAVGADNGYVCVVYNQFLNNAYTINYAVLNGLTGEVVIAPTVISGAVNCGRTFLVGSYFVITFGTSTILRAIAINTTTLAVVGPTTISTNYNPLNVTFPVPLNYDGVVISSVLYLMWPGASNSTQVMNTVTMVGSTITPGSPQTVDVTQGGPVVAFFADTSLSPNVLWGLYNHSGTAWVLAVKTDLTTFVVDPHTVAITTINNVRNGTGYAVGVASVSNATFYLERLNSKSSDTTIANRDVETWTIVPGANAAAAPTVNQITNLAYQNGLGSRVFAYGSGRAVLLSYQSPFQSSYFLVNTSGQVLMRLAYGNGAGYLYQLPIVSNTTNGYFVSYLFKDVVEALNKNTNLPTGSSVGGIYSQLGINLAIISNTTQPVNAVEIGNNLNVVGGFLVAYDGSIVNENNFWLWPELQTNLNSVSSFNLSGYGGITQATFSGSFTCSVTAGSNVITITAPTGIVPGMLLNDSAVSITAGTYITAYGTSSGVFYMSQPAIGTDGADSVTVTGNVSKQTYYYQFTYEWTDNQGNAFKSAPSIPIGVTVSSNTAEVTIKVPCLPLTYKTTPSQCKIVGYRWSVAQQIYYQFTTITVPFINDPTQQIVTIVDGWSDAGILGNNIIYTTGGVIENISPPPTNIVTLFDDRLWLVDAEDKNLLWFSKQVIESTPVEMSDLLTFFVAPTIAGRGTTGPISALGSMDDKLIIFKEKGAMYYINGSGPDNTGNNNQYSQPIFITSPVTCTNQNSITLIPNGIIFQAANSNGIWILGRDLQVQYIGYPVQQYNSYTVTSANTIPGTTEVRFTLSSGVELTYDYFAQQWNTASGICPSSYAISSTVYNNLHTLLSATSVASQETVGTYSDGAVPVAMSFTTGWINVSGLRGYERAYFFFLLGTYLSAHTITIGIAYDYDSTIVQTSTFTPAGYTVNEIENFRVFFAKQRCKAFQLTITESLTTAGAGLTISGLNMMIGLKKAYAPISAAKSVG